MLVSMKEMLADAKAKHYAIPAFDVSNYEMMRAVLDACEAERSPALLQALGVDFDGKGLPILTEMIKEATKHYTIPVCLHLDHATDIDFIRAALDVGFSSVMYDGSVLPFAENAEMTRKVVEIAHTYGATVEAELGHVGNAMVGNEKDAVKNEDPEDTLTLPSEVVRFREITDVDALAIAIGTAHGAYKTAPVLDLARLAEIRNAINTPLVLHGGSGLSDDDFRNCVRGGIAKVNIFTDLCLAGRRAMQEGLAAGEDYLTIRNRKVKEITEEVRTKMRLFGCSGKA